MTSTGRVARLTALALATGTLVATAGTAAAATSTTTVTDKIQGLGNGQVLHLRIALPVALPAVGQIIDQYVSTTNGTITTVTDLGSISTGKIGQGVVPIISDLLAGQANSSYPSKMSDSVSLIDQQNLAGLGLTVKALAAKSNVANPSKDGILSHSESTVAGLKLDALSLPAINTALDPVLNVVSGVLGGPGASSSSSPVGTVSGVLTGLTKQLDAASSGATAPVTAAINTTIAALDQLTSAITGQISGLAANPALIDLGIMKSNQTIARVGHQVTSTVTNELAGVSLLGGLVTVDALQSKAVATAGGKAGTASVIHEPGVLTVHVADLLTLKIGKTIELGGTLGDALPAELKTAVDTGLAQVLDLLRSTLGLEFLSGTSAESVSADGTSARTTVDAAKLILSPPLLSGLLPAGEKLLTLEMVGAQAAVGAQVVTLNKTVNKATPATVTSLPRTGANLPLTGAAAAALIGLAMVARRRRLAHIEG
ncbi:MAG: hypothetical protein JWM40_1663 [Frankiales bacterium]|nr:hypothetical protein [Frankiales bacterium]